MFARKVDDERDVFELKLDEPVCMCEEPANTYVRLGASTKLLGTPQEANSIDFD